MTGDEHRVAVKRDGARGWHWIARASFDPARHVPHDFKPVPAPALEAGPTQAEEPAARARARRPVKPKD